MILLKQKIIIIFLLSQPFLDIIAGTSFLNGIHVIIRGLFFIFCLFELVKNKNDYKLTLLLTTIMFIYFCSYLSLYHYGLTNSISYTLKLFYLPITTMFFYYHKDKIDDKYISIILLTYLILLMTCYIFNIGNGIYESGINKTGFKGLFNSINEFSAIVIILLPLSLDFFLKRKKYLYCFFTIVLVGMTSMLTGTKVILGGIIICLLYFLYLPFKNFFIKQNHLKKGMIITSILLSIGIIFFLITNTTAYKNAIVQAKFFKVKNITSLKGINKVVFNDRFSFIPASQKEFNKAPLQEKMLGLPYNSSRKDVEIDLFDIFYKYGIIGLLIIVSIIIYYGYKSRLTGTYLLSFILLILISETSGHVLIYPAVSIYLGIIISLNKKMSLVN